MLNPHMNYRTKTFITCLTAAHNISNTFQTKPTAEKWFSTQTTFTFKFHFGESFNPSPRLGSCTCAGILERTEREKAFDVCRLSNSFIIEYQLCWESCQSEHITDFYARHKSTYEIFHFYFDNSCGYDGWNNLILLSIILVPCRTINHITAK